MDTHWTASTMDTHWTPQKADLKVRLYDGL
jgi:hypothetical protein